MNEPRRDDFEQRLDSLFARDPGPSARELADARLRLKRARARAARPADRSESTWPLRLDWRRAGGITAQAAGFALLLALLAPLVPRLTPPAAAESGREAVAVVTDAARRWDASRWLPSLSRVTSLRLPDPREMQPSGGLFDWLPELHFEAR